MMMSAGTSVFEETASFLFAGTASGGPSGGGVTDPDLRFLRNN